MCSEEQKKTSLMCENRWTDGKRSQILPCSVCTSENRRECVPRCIRYMQYSTCMKMLRSGAFQCSAWRHRSGQIPILSIIFHALVNVLPGLFFHFKFQLTSERSESVVLVRLSCRINGDQMGFLTGNITAAFHLKSIKLFIIISISVYQRFAMLISNPIESRFSIEIKINRSFVSAWVRTPLLSYIKNEFMWQRMDKPYFKLNWCQKETQ